MNNKLFSILLAIVMVTSACVVPFVSNEDVDAADNDSTFVVGESVGVYLDINEKSINEFFTKLSGSKTTVDTNFSKSTIKTFLQLAGLDIDVLDYDIDLTVGFAITKVASDSTGYTYRITSIADGYVDVYSTNIEEAVNYNGSGNDVPVTETMDIEFEIEYGLDITLKLNTDGEIVSIDGTMGRTMEYEATKNVLESDGTGSHLVEKSIEHSSVSYLDFDMQSGSSVPLVSVTWYLIGDIDYLDDVLGAPYGNRIMNIDELGIVIPVESLETFVTTANEQTNESGLVDMEGFLNIIGCMPVEKSIGAALIMLAEEYLGVTVEAPKGNTVNDYVLATIYAFVPSYPIIDDFVPKIVSAMGIETLGDIYRLVYIEDALSEDNRYDLIEKGLDALDGTPLSSLKGTIYNLIVDRLESNEDLTDAMDMASEAIGAIKSLIVIDAIPEFIFGKQGVELTEKEMTDLNKKAIKLANKAINGLNDCTLSVNFYDETGEGLVSSKDVKFGRAVEKDNAIKNIENTTGKYFIGWFSVDDIYGLPVDLSRIYGDLDLVPVFADKVAMDDLEDALDGEADNIFVEAGSVTTIDTDMFDGKDKSVHIFVTSNGTVGSIVWTFSNAGGDVNIGFTSENKGSGIQVNFSHNGPLPAGTYVTVDVGNKFDAGNVLNVYHKNGTKKDIVNGMAVVDENGKVKVALDHCSSYVFELNEELTNFVGPADDDDEKDGINVLLIGGIVLGVLAVIGIGVFVFLKMRKKNE